jgi:hypothetical protein
VWEAWQEHLPRKPSSCTHFLKDNLAGDNSEKSIRRRHWPNSFDILNNSEELYPSLSRLGRMSFPMMRVEVVSHEEAKPTRGPGSSHKHMLRQEGLRSSSPYPYPAGGSTDTSSARSRRLPLGRPRRLGSRATCPTETVRCPHTRLARPPKQNTWRIELAKKPGWTASPACYPLPLASILLAPDTEVTTSSIRRTHTG